MSQVAPHSAGRPDPADPRSLDAIFRPRSVAVVGASRRHGSIGREILRNLVAGDFNGPVFPVNSHETVLQSMRCWPSVSDLPEPVDLAILAVPRDQVLAVVEECGRKGVRGLVLITAGFREIGGEGIRREEALVEILKRYGMRMVGPNCMGVFNTEENVRLNASFARTPPLPGKVAMVTQSGALGEVILEHALRLNVGFSMFASVGNKTDVTSADLLLYLEDDPRSEIILLYLESFSLLETFTTIARRITRRKPILAVKSGRTESGARAAISHTGALAGSDVATGALFEQCGVIRVDSVSEMFDLTRALSTQPIPAGPRLAVVTNAGGPGILATDAAVSFGLLPAELSFATREALRSVLPPEASVANPVDLLASADPARYAAALPPVLADPAVDALLVIFVPPVMIDAPGVARVIVSTSAAFPDKPVLACFMGQVRSFTDLETEYGRRVPFYPYPEEACRSLAAMARYQKLRSRPEGKRSSFTVDHARGRAIMEGAERAGRDQLLLSEAIALVETYGIPVAPWIHDSAEGILRRAEAFGFPAILKADGASGAHKTGQGLISPVLPDRDSLRTALEKIASLPAFEKTSAHPALRENPSRPAARSGEPRFVLQRMIPAAREVLIGVIQDPVFGPLLGFGLGGIFAEVLGSAVFRVLPITDLDAAEMIGAIRGREILQGLRGEAPVDRSQLASLLERVSRLIEDFPRIRELEMNPILAAPAGGISYAVDARVILSRES